jgi:hypothetical protein
MPTPGDKDAALDIADSWSAVSHLEPIFMQPIHAGMNQSSPVGYEQKNPANLKEATAAPAKVHSFEIESTVSSSSKESWLQRLPWRRGNHDRDRNSDTLDFDKPGEVIYHGGQMEPDPRPGLGFTVGQEETPAPEQPKRRTVAYAVGFSPRNDEVATFSPYSFKAVASWLSRSSSQRSMAGDEDSLADFEDSEWTQPDSSYGAAIPFGGWIPKNIRRTIESTIIAMLVIGLVYLVVATSIRVTEESASRHSNTTSNSGSDYGGVNLDDDRYIAYGNDDASAYSVYGYKSNNDDAYSNGDDTYSNDDGSGSGNGDGDGYTNNNNNGGYGYNNNANNGDDANNNNDDAYGGRRELLS